MPTSYRNMTLNNLENTLNSKKFQSISFMRIDIVWKCCHSRKISALKPIVAENWRESFQDICITFIKKM